MDLKREIALKRAEWRSLRKEKLQRKSELVARGMPQVDIRKEKAYKQLNKQQKRITARLRHLEKKLNRTRAALLKNGLHIEKEK
jgi:hypothetical protein